jgi:hypothetical protein
MGCRWWKSADGVGDSGVERTRTGEVRERKDALDCFGPWVQVDPGQRQGWPRKRQDRRCQAGWRSLSQLEAVLVELGHEDLSCCGCGPGVGRVHCRIARLARLDLSWRALEGAKPLTHCIWACKRARSLAAACTLRPCHCWRGSR